ncbi:MAG: hypothetical protein ACUVUU_00995 [bacterium]
MSSRSVLVLIVLGGIILIGTVSNASKASFGTWIGALLTIAIFSFLYKDNPVYKLAEHVFIGVAAGYFVALEYRNVFLPNLWNPLIESLGRLDSLLLLFPFALGLLLFTRFSPRIAWLSRWSIAALIGSYSGLAIIGGLQGDLVAQIRASIIPIYPSEAITGSGLFYLLQIIKNPLVVLGLVATLIYFFFSREQKGSIGVASKIGIWYLMISFGASFGYTVMSRVSLLIGRLHFLLSDWLGWVR